MVCHDGVVFVIVGPRTKSYPLRRYILRMEMRSLCFRKQSGVRKMRLCEEDAFICHEKHSITFFLTLSDHRGREVWTDAECQNMKLALHADLNGPLLWPLCHGV
eukprot:GHVO01046074.1.p3 GENE.GHVO01046074.1~~GHVO01046074.1.p3  ORF type:complete len:104 (+),score=2.48 GHVO01046074.1:398-709(+)